MRDIDIVGVAGAGAMGRGIAQIAAQARITVRLYDVQSQAVNDARAALQAVWKRLVEKQRMTAEAAAEALERIVPCSDLQEMSDADLVVEAIVERLDVKSELFTKLERSEERRVGKECR